MDRSKNLIWIDLEMTGLDTDHDVILEIATIITDSQLNVIAEGPSIVIHQPEEALAKMNGIVSQMHAKSGLVDRVRESKVSVKQAEQETMAFIKQYCTAETSPLCGNSVWQDRAFIRKYMPHLMSYLHYRVIDISAVKELVSRWYPNDPKNKIEKKDGHRALEDIRDSVRELQHYRKHFFISRWQ